MVFSDSISGSKTEDEGRLGTRQLNWLSSKGKQDILTIVEIVGAETRDNSKEISTSLGVWLDVG